MFALQIEKIALQNRKIRVQENEYVSSLVFREGRQGATKAWKMVM